MSNDQTGRTPRQTTGGAPAASTIMIVVTVVAVVIGFFILKKIRDDGDTGSTKSPTQSTVAVTTTDPTATTATTAAPVTATTVFTPVTTGTKVQVANFSTVSGAAKRVSTLLGGKSFTMGTPVNGSGAKLATSKVLYDPANPSAKAVADSVAVLMGGVAVETLPSPAPVATGKLEAGVGVLVLLGNDKAPKTSLEAMAATGTTGAAATTVAGAAATTVA